MLLNDIKTAAQEQNPLLSFHQSIGAAMDKLLELITSGTKFGAYEILKDTCEERRESQLVPPTAQQ